MKPPFGLSVTVPCAGPLTRTAESGSLSMSVSLLSTPGLSTIRILVLVEFVIVVRRDRRIVHRRDGDRNVAACLGPGRRVMKLSSWTETMKVTVPCRPM